MRRLLYALPLLLLSASPTAAHAEACEISFRAHNASSDFDVYVDVFESKVRRRVGIASSFILPSFGDTHHDLIREELGEDLFLGPGESAAIEHSFFRVNGSCSIPRRYKIRLVAMTNGTSRRYVDEYELVIPGSGDGFTTDTTIDLGDVGRFFHRDSEQIEFGGVTANAIKITYRITSPGVTFGSSEIRRRVRRGTYLRLDGCPMCLVPPRMGETGSWTVYYEPLLPRQTLRRYKYTLGILDCSGDSCEEVREVTAYYPSEAGWTAEQHVDLGDLARFMTAEERQREQRNARARAGLEQGETNEPEPPPVYQTEPVAVPTTLPDVRWARLFSEDFSDVSAGDFPRTLTYKEGGMMTARHDGRPALRIRGDGWFQITLPEALPERFTIAFDYYNPNRHSYLYVAPWDPEVSQADPGLNRYRRDSPHHYAVITPESAGVGFDSRAGLPSSTASNDAYAQRMVPVLISVDGRRGRVLVDGEPVAVLPVVDMPRTRTIDVYLSGYDRHEAYLTDLEIRGE